LCCAFSAARIEKKNHPADLSSARRTGEGEMKQGSLVADYRASMDGCHEFELLGATFTALTLAQSTTTRQRTRRAGSSLWLHKLDIGDVVQEVVLL
jgi:hypothetical protein